MEEICRKCNRIAEVTCLCDKTLRYCGTHFFEHAEKKKKKHKQILLTKIHLDAKCNIVINMLHRTENLLIGKSQKMIQVILSIVQGQLMGLKLASNNIISISKKKRYKKRNDELVDEYGNILLNEFNLNDFTEIMKSYLCILGDDNEVLPPTFNITEVIREFQKNKEENQKIAEAMIIAERTKRDEEEKIKMQQLEIKKEEEEQKTKGEIVRQIRELQRSIETFENDLKMMRGKLESYIDIFRSAGIIDRGVLIENRNKEIKNILLQIPPQSDNLRKALMPETTVEEMISTKENGNKFKADLLDMYQSCKSLLDILKQLKDECKLCINAFRALKATFDKKYIFFCN